MSNYAPAVESAAKVVAFIAESECEVGISEISRGVDLNKNMVFRILNSLEAQGWVYSSNQRYGLTLLPFRLTSKALSKQTLNTAATSVLYELLETTGESTYLGVLQGEKVLYIQHLDGLKDVRVAGRVGGEYDIYCSAPGKVLLAFSNREFIEDYISRPHEKRTENSIVDRELLSKELETIRNQGYATDRQEFGNGITCVAAPVYDHTDKVIASVGCSAFTLSKNSDEVIERLHPAVVAAAEQISRRLGYKK